MKDKLLSLFNNEQFRSAVWMFFAVALVGYFGIMLILRFALGSGGTGLVEVIVATIFALVAATIAARKRYQDDI
ncbi:hypothetical protein [Corynebacterium sp. H113]|uniref:hypothetical protein n=1 Tax=Corynebacterium sp. H113 TaxID=3133419 RepID=UPI003095210C